MVSLKARTTKTDRPVIIRGQGRVIAPKLSQWGNGKLQCHRCTGVVRKHEQYVNLFEHKVHINCVDERDKRNSYVEYQVSALKQELESINKTFTNKTRSFPLTVHNVDCTICRHRLWVGQKVQTHEGGFRHKECRAQD